MKKQNIQIRETNKNDFFQTEKITREAFWNLFQPGCDEHLALHQLRKSDSYIAELDLVAMQKDQIIGHAITTKAYINDINKHEVLCVGPISVLPSFQGKGIGSKLMNHSISIARDLGFKAMILFGNPDYYHRFGFQNAKKFEISTKDGQNFDSFMALELYENSLKNVRGTFYEDKAFETKEENLSVFEKKFPFKEKGKAKINLANLK